MATKLQEKQGRRAQLQKEINDVFEKHPDLDLSQDELNVVQTANKELSDLAVEIKDLSDLARMADESKRGLAEYNTPASDYGYSGDRPGEGGAGEFKTLGELFTDSEAYQAYKAGRLGLKNLSIDIPTFDFKRHYEWKEAGIYDALRAARDLPYEVKTTITTGAGFAPKNIRSDTVIPGALQRPLVLPQLPTYNTTNQTTKWMAETTTTNNAAPTAEGAAPASESALAWTEQTALVEKCASYISVTQEQLDDVDNLQSIINDRLLTMHAVKEDSLALTGTGTTPQIRGFLAIVGIQTVALGAYSLPDVIALAVKNIRTDSTTVSMCEPNMVIMHPTNWFQFQTLTTPDGVYIWGSPAEAVRTPQIWGMPVIITTNITLNTGLVGDFNQCRVARRKGVTLSMTDSHGTQFTTDTLTIKTTSRFVIEHYRAKAFHTITALP